MPVNLSLNNSNATEHQSCKYGAMSLTEDTRGADGKGGGSAPLALVKIEGQTPMTAACSGGSYQEDSKEQMRMVYEQSCYNLSLAGYLKNGQRSTPDSTYEDAVEGQVRLVIQGE